MAIKDDVAHNYGHAQSRAYPNSHTHTYTGTHTQAKAQTHTSICWDKTRQGINKNDASIQISLARLRQYIVAFMRILCIMRNSRTFLKTQRDSIKWVTQNYPTIYTCLYIYYVNQSDFVCDSQTWLAAHSMRALWFVLRFATLAVHLSCVCMWVCVCVCACVCACAHDCGVA